MEVCQEPFEIVISPQRELKSGERRDEVDIYILSQGRKIGFYSLSAGQRQRVNVSVLIAIYKWAREMGQNHLDFLILDEVLDLSLGKQGQEDITRFISGLCPDINHIMIISHKDTLPDVSYTDLYVERGTDEISRVKPN